MGGLKGPLSVGRSITFISILPTFQSQNMPDNTPAVFNVMHLQLLPTNPAVDSVSPLEASERARVATLEERLSVEALLAILDLDGNSRQPIKRKQQWKPGQLQQAVKNCSGQNVHDKSQQGLLKRNFYPRKTAPLNHFLIQAVFKYQSYHQRCRRPAFHGAVYSTEKHTNANREAGRGQTAGIQELLLIRGAWQPMELPFT